MRLRSKYKTENNQGKSLNTDEKIKTIQYSALVFAIVLTGSVVLKILL